MKLMRHSDIKSTAKVYTDEMQLPIYDSIKNLPRLGGCTQMRAQTSGAKGKTSHSQSRRVEGQVNMKAPSMAEIGALWRTVSQPLKWSGWKESNPHNEKGAAQAL